ncbi:hypothetical protein SME10J_47000 [Serratia marcescens]|nr:hypothetical protein SME10J_47000 [Serratia marcescens]
MAPLVIKIQLLRVRLYTSRALAESLQQAVSHAVHSLLPSELTVGISPVAHRPDMIASLTLDLGEFPREGFETQFVQRLIRKLREALSALPSSGDEEPAASVGQTDTPDTQPRNRKDLATAIEEAVTRLPPLSISSDRLTAREPITSALLPACLWRFLQTGYWPYPGGTSAAEGDKEVGFNPERALKKQSISTPAHALTQLLAAQSPPAAEALDMLAHHLWRTVARRRLWQCLGEQQRRQLFSLFTTEQRLVSPPQQASISPAGLMLAAWHYALHRPASVLTAVGERQNHDALAALTPAEVDWLNALLPASATHPALLAAVLPPLRRHVAVWGSQLSAAAQQLWQNNAERDTGCGFPNKNRTLDYFKNQTPFAHQPKQGTDRQGKEERPVSKVRAVHPANHQIPFTHQPEQGTDRQGKGELLASEPRPVHPANQMPFTHWPEQSTDRQGKEEHPVSEKPFLRPYNHQIPPSEGREHILYEGHRIPPPWAEHLEQDVSLPHTLQVSNAGVVLLWPLLPRLFIQLELLEKPQHDAPYRFISQQTQQRAVWVLDALVWADDEPAEWRSMVNKWLCNWPLAAPLEVLSPKNNSQQQFLTSWLSTLSVQIPGLQQCGPDELRALFLQRPGVMQEGRNGWHLTVEGHASDIMLSRLPWPLKQLTLPWLPEPLEVVWQLPDYPVF